MTLTESRLNILNTYSGDNIWQDVIWRLPIDDDATDAVDVGMDDRFFTTDGVLYFYVGESGLWKCARDV